MYSQRRGVRRYTVKYCACRVCTLWNETCCSAGTPTRQRSTQYRLGDHRDLSAIGSQHSVLDFTGMAIVATFLSIAFLSLTFEAPFKPPLHQNLLRLPTRSPTADMLMCCNAETKTDVFEKAVAKGIKSQASLLLLSLLAQITHTHTKRRMCSSRSLSPIDQYLSKLLRCGCPVSQIYCSCFDSHR